MNRHNLNIIKPIMLSAMFLLNIAQSNGQGFFDYGFEFSTVGTTGMNFLKIGSGARSAGLAMTGTGLVGQAENLYHNPAGIAFLDGRDVSLATNNWLAGSVQHGVAIAAPAGPIVWGLTLVNFRINEFEETTVFKPDGTGSMITAGDIQLGFSLARRFTDKLGIGGQVKLIQENIAEYNSNNILIDLGATYFLGWQDTRVSFVFQHFGPDIKVGQTFGDFGDALKEFLSSSDSVEVKMEPSIRMPLIFRIGIAANLLNTYKNKVLLVAELSHPIDNLEQLSYGLEYSFLNRVHARMGKRIYIGGDDDLLDSDHRATNDGQAVFGFGLNVTKNIAIDYALSPHGDAMGDIHHFSAGFKF